jgi:hypothetical protein
MVRSDMSRYLSSWSAQPILILCCHVPQSIVEPLLSSALDRCSSKPVNWHRPILEIKQIASSNDIRDASNRYIDSDFVRILQIKQKI